MTVIAWKDGVMAADSVSSRGDTRYHVKKLHRVENVLAGFAGGTDSAEALLEWFRRGRRPDDFPKSQEKDNFAVAVFALSGKIFTIDQTPYPTQMLAPFGAIGNGREVAIGAMAAGASAEGAVIHACTWCDGCGGPLQIEKYL